MLIPNWDTPQRVEQLAREANLDEVTVEMVEQTRLEFGQ
jgi:hypothetical protein